MTCFNTIYELAQKLFDEKEWPSIKASLETCLESHTRSLIIDGRLAAFLIVNQIDGDAFISYCGVDPAFQGKGYGSKLLKETLSSIFQADFKVCRLYVDDWNVGARRLYERLGFKMIAPVMTPGGPCGIFEIRCAHTIAPSEN